MNLTGINLDYAVKSSRTGQKYPALQVTEYKPKTLSDRIDWCLSESSYELLDSDSNSFETEVVKCVYNRTSTLMHRIKSDLRWVFLNIPSVFFLDKDTKKITVPQRGEKLAGTDRVTIAKCFLACLCNDNFILDLEGSPQMFTLKLTSNKTQLIGYLNNNSETKTILSLNTALQKHYKLKSDLVHLVSIRLSAKPKEFVSSVVSASSLGVNFEIEGNAKPLNPQQQKQIFDLITKEEIEQLFNDPFNLGLSSTNNPISFSEEDNDVIDYQF